MDKPIDEAALTTVRFLDGGVVQMDRADYDRLTAARQQGQAVEPYAYMQDCSLPGVTSLKSQGKPAWFTCMTVKDELHTFPLYAAPPSAPVGVEGLVASLVDAAYQDGMQELDEMSADTVRARSAVIHALAQQPAPDKFIATFRCEGNDITGTTNAPIHSISMHDDGVIEVVIDYWPEQPAAVDEAMVFRLAVWMAKQDGHDDPHHLILEGSPPEPWGEIWMRYEDDARSALTVALAAQPGGSDNG